MIEYSIAQAEKYLKKYLKEHLGESKTLNIFK